MKLLLNDKEISAFLFDLLRVKKSEIEDTEMQEDFINIAKGSVFKETTRKKFKLNDAKRKKFKDKIRKAVIKDLNIWFNKVSNQINLLSYQKRKTIQIKIDKILLSLGEEKVLTTYKKHNFATFVKGVGLHIDSSAQVIRRRNYNNLEENCLLRNTTGNENILVDKIDHAYPFWFIDSGYTNFLEPNKKWHRLVKNHIHFTNNFSAPVNRLGNFKIFPQQWRTSGDRILIIEPGIFAASIFHVDIKMWKYRVEEELRQYTDKKIIFREKNPKKQRAPLFKHLCDEDYYCVISINSNAATEAVWAGIPIITLDKHITNSISKNKLSDINDLSRPQLANWLCMLSYSQFTYQELMDGTAVKLVKKYNV